MNCPKCNAVMPTDAIFCGICGKSLPGKHPERSAKSYVSTGFEAFKTRPFFLIFTMIMLMLIPYLVNWLSIYLTNILSIKPDTTKMMNLNQIMGLVWILAANLIWAGFLYSSLKIVRGETPGITDIFSGFKRPFSVILIYIFTISLTVAIWIGFKITAEIVLQLMKPESLSVAFMLFPVWDLIFQTIAAISLFFMSIPILVMMDKQQGAFKALATSYKITRGYKSTFIVLSLLLFLINIFGLLAVIVGLIITMSISVTSIAAFYDQSSQTNI